MKRPTDKQQEHEWIERYLNDQMTDDERTDVERERQNDSDFDEEVRGHGRMHQLIQEVFLEQQAVATVRQLQQQTRQHTRRIRLGSRAVAGIVGAGIALILYLSLTPIVFPDSENDITVTRSLADDDSSSVAIDQQLVFNQFFEGQARMTEGQYALAVVHFERVVKAPDLRPYFREAAQWHLVVAYLKSGRSTQAERIYDQFVACTDCEYPISRIDRWKIWWQIKWAQWVG